MAVGGHSVFAKSNCKIEPPNLQPNFTGNSFVEPDFNLWKIVDSLVCPTTVLQPLVLGVLPATKF